jgi:hypothetical protein
MISAYAGGDIVARESWPEKADPMWYALTVWLGSIGLVLLIGWRIHRHQRDIDGYYPREYRAPLAFQWHGWL